MSNVLDPSSVLHTISRLLPKQDTGNTNNEPLLRHKHDALAALAHAIMVSVGFRLTNLGDTEHKGKPFLKRTKATSSRTVDSGQDS
jgi:hypothetical protein